MTQLSSRLRLGAVALGVCSLLFAAFPLLRPFFRLDVFSPTLAAVPVVPLPRRGGSSRICCSRRPSLCCHAGCSPCTRRWPTARPSRARCAVWSSA